MAQKRKVTFDEQLQRALQVQSIRAKIGQLIDDELFVIDGIRRRGRAKGGGQSSKAKGRAGCQTVQALLLQHFPTLTADDIYVKAGSQGGADLHLSPRAIESLNWSIEVKNSESLSVWAMIKQAEREASRNGRMPIVFFKRANSGVYVALKAEDFLKCYIETWL